ARPFSLCCADGILTRVISRLRPHRQLGPLALDHDLVERLVAGGVRPVISQLVGRPELFPHLPDAIHEALALAVEIGASGLPRAGNPCGCTRGALAAFVACWNSSSVMTISLDAFE